MVNYHRCFVNGCTEYKKNGTSFHKFPTKNAKEWCYLIQTLNNQSNAYDYKPNSLVCGWHFGPHQKISVGKFVRLKNDAMPTLFEGYDDNVSFINDDTTQLLDKGEGKNSENSKTPTCTLTSDQEKFNLENLEEPFNEKEKSLCCNNCDDDVCDNSSCGVDCHDSDCEDPCDYGTDHNDDILTCDDVIDSDIETYDYGDTAHLLSSSSSRKRKVESSSDLSSEKRLRYFGDIKNLDFTHSPQTLNAFGVCQRTIISAKRKIKTLQQKIWRRNKKIQSMKDVLTKLKEKYNLSSDAISHLSMNYSDAIIVQLASGKSTKEYSDEVKAFACTLNFYSPAAYEYIRTKFNKNLPSQSTIQSWYKCVDGSAGISPLAMKILEDRVADRKGGKVFVSLLIDEMAIRVLKFWNHGLHKWEGLVDFGNQYIKTDDTPASKVLVFLVNEINGSGKVPVAHYFTHNLNGEILRTLVVNALEMLHKTGVIVMALTFDGPQPNISMDHLLGGNVWNPDDLRCSFPHPVTKEPVFLFLDVVHMIKLIRNTLGAKGLIYDDQNKAVRWEYIVKLVELQQKEGLTFATKLRNRHIKYHNEKMKVRLAVQVFSESVAVALEYCLMKKLPEFAGCEPTIRFIRKFDKLFDILNSRNLSAPGFKKGISYKNCSTYFDFFEEASCYIRKLTTNKVDSVLKSKSRTGFIGFLNAMASTKKMYHLYVNEKKDLKFLLMYHFTQDPLETLFSVIRSKRGADNNPTTKQFQGIWKRLLMYNEIRRFNRIGNTSDDKINLFTARNCLSQINRNAHTDDELELMNAEIDCQLDDEDFLGTILTEVTVDIVVYIAGYVERKLKSQLKCEECCECLSDETVSSDLINLKNKGGLIHPQKNVVDVCKETEKLIRFLDIDDRFFYEKARILCFRALTSKNIFHNMNDHILEQPIIDNHKTLIISAIIDLYIKIRMHHEGRVFCEELKSSRIRSKNAKLTLFAGQ